MADLLFICCCSFVVSYICCSFVVHITFKKYFINRNWPFRLSCKLIVSVLQVKHERVPSKIIQYRGLQKF